MGNFHRSVEIARVTDFFCNVQSHPKDHHRFLLQCSEQWAMDVPGWVPKLYGKKSLRNRDRFATESPATCQIWMGGSNLFWGQGAWGRPTLPRGTSPFCVCTSSTQCSDSFKRHVRAFKPELNLPKLLHQALSAEVSPFSGIGGRKRHFAVVKPVLVQQGQSCHFIHESCSWKCYVSHGFWVAKAQNC